MNHVCLSIATTLCTAFFVTGCVSERLPAVGLNDALHIPAAEIPSLKAKAQAGDSKASERLASYYGFYVKDKKQWIYYLKLGAKNGSAMAAESLVTIYGTDPEVFDFAKALVFRQRLKQIASGSKVTIKTDEEWAYEMFFENAVAQSNKKRGILFLKYAAKHGSTKAQKDLAQMTR